VKPKTLGKPHKSQKPKHISPSTPIPRPKPTKSRPEATTARPVVQAPAAELPVYTPPSTEEQPKPAPPAPEIEEQRLAAEAKAHLDTGDACRLRGDNVQAIVEYTRAIDLDPKCAVAFNNRGWMYDQIDDYDKAIRDYDQAINLDPALDVAIKNREATYGRKQQYDKLGFSVCELTPELIAEFQLREDAKGVLVRSVSHRVDVSQDYEQPGIPDPELGAGLPLQAAARALGAFPLRRGMVIVGIMSRKRADIKSISDFDRATEKVQPGAHLLLFVLTSKAKMVINYTVSRPLAAI
jgi:tetratricopeptide (TPR) repeat protein